MKTKINFFLSIAGLLSSFLLNAQLYVQGSIPNWNYDDALVVSEDFVTGKMDTWGSVSPNGEVQLVLEYDFMTILKEKAEAAKKDAPQGWSLSFKTVADTFGSNSSYFPGDFVYENGDAVVAGVPDLIVGSEAKKEKYGMLYMANSPEMAKWLYNYQMGSINPGYYIQYFFVEKDASVKGQVSILTGTNSGEEFDSVTQIDLKLEEGWNIIKHEIAEVFTANDGSTYPSKTIISQEKVLPADVQWIVLADN